jgi:thioredoxin reductase
MTLKDTYEVIIVGGGPAGVTAGLYCKRAALAAAEYVEVQKSGRPLS